MNTILDVENELAAIEERRRELHTARQQRIRDPRCRLAACEDRLRQLGQPAKPIDPHTQPAVRAAHRRFCDAVELCERFIPYHELPYSQRIKGNDSYGQPIALPGVFEAKQAECQRLNEAAREAQAAYQSTVMAPSDKLQGEDRATEQRAAAETARVQEEITGIEAELARLEQR